MRGLRSFYLQPRRCLLSGPRHPLPEAIAARLSSIVHRNNNHNHNHEPPPQHQQSREFHKDAKKDTKETKELNATGGQQQNPDTLLRIHPEPYLEPTLYMSVANTTNSRKMFDVRPPGTHHESGAIKGKPTGTKRGRWKAVGLVLALIYMGGQLSSLGARMLHEFEIFAIPDEDDDD